MHEHGLVMRLIEKARREASARGGTLRAMRVRLGALSTSDAAHFREEVEHVCQEHGLGPIGLEIEEDRDRPSGLELVSIELG
jgi:Zn finger protein HypA/HybF involved in hydrogenase expression